MVASSSTYSAIVAGQLEQAAWAQAEQKGQRARQGAGGPPAKGAQHDRVVVDHDGQHVERSALRLRQLIGQHLSQRVDSGCRRVCVDGVCLGEQVHGRVSVRHRECHLLELPAWPHASERTMAIHANATSIPAVRKQLANQRTVVA